MVFVILLVTVGCFFFCCAFRRESHTMLCGRFLQSQQKRLQLSVWCVAFSGLGGTLLLLQG